MICEKAIQFLKPGGHLVYATCSILKAENDEQIERLVKNYSLEVVTPPFRSLPNQIVWMGFSVASSKKRDYDHDQ